MLKSIRFPVAVAIFFSCLQAGAQGILVKGGLNLANVLEKDNSFDYGSDYTMNPGFHVGVAVDIHVVDLFSIETGLMFDQKGFRYHNDVPGLEIKARTVLYYLDLPVNLKVKHDFDNGTTICGTLGPYIGYGLYGNYKEVFDFQGTTEIENDVRWGNDENATMKPLDFGIGAGVVLEVRGIVLGISYDLGLANLSPTTDEGEKLNNRVLRISAGYHFAR